MALPILGKPLCAYPNGSSREVFVRFLGKEWALDRHGRLAGQHCCSKVFLLRARPYVALGLLALVCDTNWRHQITDTDIGAQMHAYILTSIKGQTKTLP